MDYNSRTITATFSPGTTSTTITVPVMNDDVVEGTELFNLEIVIDQSSRKNATVGNRTTATGQIIDSTG